MPTWQRCDEKVNELAAEILTQYENHRPILDAKMKIDYVFAYPDYDSHGEPLNDALKLNGVKAIGICRKTSLKERALGHGDAEISLDGDWWKNANPDEQAALLDHELYHIEVEMERNGLIKRDDLRRPKLKLRPHDYQFGWFRAIAERHRESSQECLQAKAIMDQSGQFFWPLVSALRGVIVVTP